MSFCMELQRHLFPEGIVPKSIHEAGHWVHLESSNEINA